MALEAVVGVRSRAAGTTRRHRMDCWILATFLLAVRNTSEHVNSIPLLTIVYYPLPPPAMASNSLDFCRSLT